jgi:ubiquinone/menaquinone biosynthesis C-methylase UbiE
MVVALYDFLLDRRARKIVDRIQPHLPADGTVLDFGCGTGHNAKELRRRRPDAEVLEADVVQMNPSTTMLRIASDRIPLDNAAVRCTVLCYVLHYSLDPIAVLREIRRVTRDRVILLQTTADSAIARSLWRVRDAIYGRWAFHVCRLLKLVPAGTPCPMERIATSFTSTGLLTMLVDAGFEVRVVESRRWPLTTLSRDLVVVDIRR